jgi:hypothetical protein
LLYDEKHRRAFGESELVLARVPIWLTHNSAGRPAKFRRVKARDLEIYTKNSEYGE